MIASSIGPKFLLVKSEKIQSPLCVYNNIISTLNLIIGIKK